MAWQTSQAPHVSLAQAPVGLAGPRWVRLPAAQQRAGAVEPSTTTHSWQSAQPIRLAPSCPAQLPGTERTLSDEHKLAHVLEAAAVAAPRAGRGREGGERAWRTRPAPIHSACAAHSRGCWCGHEGHDVAPVHNPAAWVQALVGRLWTAARRGIQQAPCRRRGWEHCGMTTAHRSVTGASPSRSYAAAQFSSPTRGDPNVYTPAGGRRGSRPAGMNSSTGHPAPAAAAALASRQALGSPLHLPLGWLATQRSAAARHSARPARHPASA